MLIAESTEMPAISRMRLKNTNRADACHTLRGGGVNTINIVYVRLWNSLNASQQNVLDMSADYTMRATQCVCSD